MLRPWIRASHHSAHLEKAAFEAQSVASFGVQACRYVNSRKPLRVGEYSDLCRSELEQQFLKRASALVSELCDEYCGKTGRKNGEVFTSPVRSAFLPRKTIAAVHRALRDLQGVHLQ